MLTGKTVVMFYVSRQGGARSDHLCQKTIRLLGFCITTVIPPSWCSEQVDGPPEQIVQQGSQVVSQDGYHEIHFSNVRGPSYRSVCYLSQQKVPAFLFQGRSQEGISDGQCPIMLE